jgi:UDP-N-acetyl-D-glucosamine dehydrogenase
MLTVFRSGNPQFQTKNIPKIVGGHGEASTQAACALLSDQRGPGRRRLDARRGDGEAAREHVPRGEHRLVNEIALMCHNMEVNVWGVLDAAKTKPFGFMAFYPGPGLGGHCTPIDPFYLLWTAKQSGFEARFIELAGQVNGAMPEYAVQASATR